MEQQWKIEAEKPRFATSRLASLQAESPSNSQTDEGLGLLVALWCGRESIQISIGDNPTRFSFGFTVGEIEVAVKNGKISSQNRFKQEFFREKIDQNEKDTAQKEGKIGGILGIDFSKLLAGTKLSLEGGARISKGSVILEEKKGEYFRVYWRVADAGHNRWRCFGVGLNEHDVLENKILGDDILCFVIPDQDQKEISVFVRYFCDLKDLWFEHEKNSSLSENILANNGQRNRELISAAIVARALNQNSRHSEGVLGRRLVLLCQQRIIARRISGEKDG